MKQKNINTKKITILSLFAALAITVMFVVRIPVGGFLTYEPKDVVITIAGLIYGPLSALMISTVVAFIEMITISTTSYIGFILNLIASTSFCCTTALIYKKKRTMGGAYLGLFVGLISSTTLMILWNYFLTPIYLGVPQEAVIEMLLPLLLPFNLIKNGLNATATALLYKPITTALRKTNLLPIPEYRRAEANKTKKIIIWLVAEFIFLALACALFYLATN